MKKKDKFNIPNFKFPLFKVYCPKNIGKKIERAMLSGEVSEGRYSEEFEEKFSKNFNLNQRKCVLLNSGTSALTLAYRLMNLKKNDEVISSPMTCPATNEPLFNSDIKVKFADIDKDTGNLNLDHVKKLINKKTKAIIVVHWGGQPVDLIGLKKIIKNRDIKIVEDAAHALGAKLNNKYIGHHSDFVCFSFQAIKHMTTGDGGMLVCKNLSHANLARKLRWFGISRDYIGNKWKQDIKVSGYKFHLNNLASLIGIEQLKTINDKINVHKFNGKYLDKNIKNEKIKLIKRLKNSESSYWIYSILVDNKNNFKKYINSKGIRCDEVSFRNDRYTIFKKYKVSPLPGTDYFDKHMVNIPVGWWINKKQISYITKKLNEYR
jgi:dTDP-4-amino-4,6-dideoxygalactose transaminase